MRGDCVWHHAPVGPKLHLAFQGQSWATCRGLSSVYVEHCQRLLVRVYCEVLRLYCECIAMSPVRSFKWNGPIHQQPCRAMAWARGSGSAHLLGMLPKRLQSVSQFYVAELFQEAPTSSTARAIPQHILPKYSRRILGQRRKAVHLPDCQMMAPGPDDATLCCRSHLLVCWK